MIAHHPTARCPWKGIFFLLVLIGLFLRGNRYNVAAEEQEEDLPLKERLEYLQIYCDFFLTQTEHDGVVALTWQWQENTSLPDSGHWVENTAFRYYMEPLVNNSISALGNVSHVTKFLYAPFILEAVDQFKVACHIRPAVRVFEYDEDADGFGHLIQPLADEIPAAVRTIIENFWFVSEIGLICYMVPEGEPRAKKTPGFGIFLVMAAIFAMFLWNRKWISQGKAIREPFC